MNRNATTVVLTTLFVVILAALVTGGPMVGWGMMGWGTTARGMMSGGMVGGTYAFSPVWGIAIFLLCGLAIAGLIAIVSWLVGSRNFQDQPKS